MKTGPTLIAVFTKAKIVQNMCFSSSEKYKKAIQWLSWYFKKLNPLGEKISLSSYSQESFLYILNSFMLRVLYLVKEVRMP